MARINVDDSWFIDITKRRADLVKAIASQPANPEFLADGMALNAWRLGQEYWKKNRKLIPEEVWQRYAFEPLIDCGLAERREDGIYVKGSKDNYAWLLKKSKAGKKGGKASGEKRKQTPSKRKQSEAPAKQDEAEAKQDEAARSGSNPLPLPLPPSPPLALVNKTNPNGLVSPDGDPPRPFGPKSLAKLWNENCGRLPKVDALDPVREKHARARLREKPDPEYWLEVIRRIAASNFCLGANDRAWAASFSFLIRPGTHVKALEGLYDNREGFKPDKSNFDAEMEALRKKFEAEGIA